MLVNAQILMVHFLLCFKVESLLGHLESSEPHLVRKEAVLIVLRFSAVTQGLLAEIKIRAVLCIPFSCFELLNPLKDLLMMVKFDDLLTQWQFLLLHLI